jgi:hypothetical protein
MTTLNTQKCSEEALASVDAPWGYRIFLNRNADVAYPIQLTFDEWWDVYQNQYPDFFYFSYFQIL